MPEPSMVAEAEAILSVAKVLDGMTREEALRVLAMSAISQGLYEMASSVCRVLLSEFPENRTEPSDA